MYRISCAEVWGGVRDLDRDVCTSGIDASIFSGAASGGKGGDIYYFSVCQGDLITRVVIADMRGHGSQVSDTSKWLYDAMATRMNDLDSNLVLLDVNKLVYAHGYNALTTAAVASFITKGPQLYLAYAGHHPIYLRRRGTDVWEAVKDKSPRRANLPLGVDADTQYAQQQELLAPGDRLLFYTDGVLETPNESDEFFGSDRLVEVLNEHRDRSLPDLKSSVIEALRRHRNGPPRRSA